MRRLLISALLLCSAPVSAQHLAPEDYIFPLRDNFSGIGSYTATLDGEWILLERNPMQGTITHTFDDSRTPKGRSYTLQLTVTDNCGNKTVWKRTITR